MATRKLALKLSTGIPTLDGGVCVESGEKMQVFEVNPDAKLLIVVLKSDDCDEQSMTVARTRLRQQLEKHRIDCMLFAVGTGDEVEFHEEIRDE